jgi:hypothetical protein
MRMRHVALGIAAFFFASILATESAHAASITFQIDCNIVGTSSPSCDPVASIGTIKIVDSAIDTNLVRITLTLFNASIDPQQFFLNFTGSPGSGFAFQTSTGDNVDYQPDLLKADGYDPALFDLSIPRTGNISGNPYTTLLSLQNGATFFDLNAAQFNALTGGPGPADKQLYAAALVTGGGGWYGSQHVSVSDDVDINPTGIVPEPASLTLLGTGLIAAVARLRRRARTR